MNWKTHREQLLLNPEVAQEHSKSQLEYQIARALIQARTKKDMTQTELAKKMNTKQSVISRIEQGTRLPSLSFLKRLADALHMNLEITLI